MRMNKRALTISLTVLGAVALLWAVLMHRDELYRAAAWAGRVNPVLFVLAYALLTALFIPAGPLTMLAGALFGVALGAVYAFAGAILGASTAFMASRYLMRSHVKQYAARSPRVRAIMSAADHQGKRVVFLLRLSPVIPFSIINMTMAVTSIRFGDFVVASLGMIPVSRLYAYYGAMVGAVLALSGNHPHKDAAYWITLGVGLVATLAVTVIVGRMAQRAIRLEEDASEADGAQRSATP